MATRGVEPCDVTSQFSWRRTTVGAPRSGSTLNTVCASSHSESTTDRFLKPLGEKKRGGWERREKDVQHTLAEEVGQQVL